MWQSDWCSEFYGFVTDDTIGIYQNFGDLLEIIHNSKNAQIIYGSYTEVFEKIKASLSESDQKSFGITSKRIKFNTPYTKF